jgi:hypothetical protein
MSYRKSRYALVLLSIFIHEARADYYEQRFSLGVGIAQVNNPSQTSLEIGAEYEYRFAPMLGAGALVDYIFSNPSITYLGAPEVFLHPFATDFLLSAAPLIKISDTTSVGVRLGTRIPIPLGLITLVPIFAVDLISGGPDYIYGLGFQI